MQQQELERVHVLTFRFYDRIVQIPLYAGYPCASLTKLLSSVLGPQACLINAVSNAELGVVSLQQFVSSDGYEQSSTHTRVDFAELKLIVRPHPLDDILCLCHCGALYFAYACSILARNTQTVLDIVLGECPPPARSDIDTKHVSFSEVVVLAARCVGCRRHILLFMLYSSLFLAHCTSLSLHRTYPSLSQAQGGVHFTFENVAIPFAVSRKYRGCHPICPRGVFGNGRTRCSNCVECKKQYRCSCIFQVCCCNLYTQLMLKLPTVSSLKSRTLCIPCVRSSPSH